MIITIDGPVATGKSTIARKLSQSLGFIYFDTGAMYRILTYALMIHKIEYHDPKVLEEFLKTFEFRIKTYRGQKQYLYEGQDVTLQIRENAINVLVSEISAMPTVREKLVDLQRKMSVGVNVVFEGRDMGTVVFPDAPLKIFLTATLEERARRRLEELKKSFPDQADKFSVEQVMKETSERDLYDSSRKLSPLKQAEDAHLIDCTQMSAEEVVYKILEIKDKVRPKAIFGR